MKNLTKLLLVMTVLRITSSYLFENIEWGNRMISIEELQETIENSIDCPYDLASPFTDKDTLETLLQNEASMTNGEKRYLTYENEGYTITLKIQKFDTNIEILKEKLFKKNVVLGEYKKSQYGVAKQINIDHNGSVDIVLNQNMLKIFRRFFVHNNLNTCRYLCMIRPTGDKITLFGSSLNNFNKTSVLYTTGAWFEGQSNIDIENREIIMGIHNYRIHFRLSNESPLEIQMYDYNQSSDTLLFTFEVTHGQLTSHEALFTMSEFGYMGEYSFKGFIGNHVMVRCKQRNGVINTKIYKNYGIIVLSGAILVNSYHPCEQNRTDLKYWLRNNFQNITADKILMESENIGFLVYTTPEGETYRTSDNVIITKFVNDEYYKMFYNCSKISYIYFVGNEKYTIIKNYGIIENGKLVRQSNNLIDHGVAMEYAPDNSVNIKWNKL